jgi:hypothetical protein
MAMVEWLDKAKKHILYQLIFQLQTLLFHTFKHLAKPAFQLFRNAKIVFCFNSITMA